MKRLVLILSLLLIAAPLSAQGNGSRDTSNRVYILVVDDFGDHFTALSNRLRSDASVRTRLQTEVQRLPRRGSSSRQAGQPTATPPPSTANLRNDLRQQARQAVTEAVQGNIDQQDCTVVPEGQSFFATSGTSFFATSGTGFFATSGTGAQAAAQPHGVRVAAEVQDLVKKYSGRNQIDVVPVDTDGYTTSIISNRITQTINQLSSQHPNASFVVNMSFAVVPCAALADIAVYDALMHQADADLAGDLDAMQAVFASLLASGVYNQTPGSGDAMQTFVTARCRNTRAVCNSGTNRVIMVAAAGNSGASFPFYPAAWGGVISVSASMDNTDFIAAAGTRAAYSNAGGVLMPGVWGREMGTSFAAPRYSFAMALYLLGAVPGSCSALQPSLPDDWVNSPPAVPDQKLC